MKSSYILKLPTDQARWMAAISKACGLPATLSGEFLDGTQNVIFSRVLLADLQAAWELFREKFIEITEIK